MGAALLWTVALVGTLLITACHPDHAQSAAAESTRLHLATPAEWTALAGSPAPRGTPDHVEFSCPFPADADRHVWDAAVDRIDLSSFSGMEIDFTLISPTAFRGVTWYARSGTGWYAIPLPVSEGRQRAWLPFHSFEELDGPTGWDRITGFRLSPWTAGRGEGTVVLHGVYPRSSRIAIVPPSARSIADAGERAFGRRNAEQWAADLAALGQPAALLEEADLNRRSLAAYNVVVLPYNPQLPGDLLRVLRGFVDQGGHIIVSYNANPQLASLVGVQVDRWIAAEPAGRWHQMVFTEETDWQGPDRVTQAGTPHLLPVRPANSDAFVLADWHHATGRRQREAALVVSPRGAWFSYLLSSDDEPRRRRMIAFLIDRFLPDTAMMAAQRRIEDLEKSAEDLDTAAWRQARERARITLEAGDAGAAWAAVDELSAVLAQEVANAQQWPDHLPLGIWDHSGRGLHEGDWSLTSAELAAAGFTDVFVYVPRTARRPARAVAAGAEAGLAMHAWHICFKVAELPAADRRNWERQGRLQESATGHVAAWLCPSLPENRRHEVGRLLELAGTPGLRGIHLDYIRYPDAHHCFGPTCREGFQAEIGQRVSPWPTAVQSGAQQDAFLEWRAEQVSRFVEEAAQALRAAHPDLVISMAVWPDVRTVKPQLGQDWPRWLEEGWVDWMIPMSYTESTGELAAWTRSHTQLPGAGDRIWAGLGVTSSHTRLTPDQTVRQAQAAAEAGAAGIVVFDLNTTVRTELFPVLNAIQSGRTNE